MNMGCHADGMLLVRADLCDRLDRLQAQAQRLAMRDLVQGIGAIRIMAAAYGIEPVERLALAFERAILAEPRGCPAGLYFDRLRDAVGCERLDASASEALIASVSVRLGA
jgi:hypothetical protein